MTPAERTAHEARNERRAAIDRTLRKHSSNTCIQPGCCDEEYGAYGVGWHWPDENGNNISIEHAILREGLNREYWPYCPLDPRHGVWLQPLKHGGERLTAPRRQRGTGDGYFWEKAR
jgi:hypothetical protein